MLRPDCLDCLYERNRNIENKYQNWNKETKLKYRKDKTPLFCGFKGVSELRAV